MCPTKPKIFLLYGPAQSKFAGLQPKPHSWQMSCDLLPKAFLTNRSTDVTILQLQKLKLSRPMVGSTRQVKYKFAIISVHCKVKPN